MKLQSSQKILSLFIALTLAFGFTAASSLAAGHHISRPRAKVNSSWERKADRNNNGYVDPHEADKAKKDFIKNRAVVNSSWEQHADRNNDGYVDPHEEERAND